LKPTWPLARDIANKSVKYGVPASYLIQVVTKWMVINKELQGREHLAEGFIGREKLISRGFNLFVTWTGIRRGN
jgi:hypothetical protein